MPKYHVHLYPIVRVLVRDIEAESQVEAIKKAEAQVDWDAFLSHSVGMLHAEFADDFDGFHVDEDGDPEHERSTGYDKNYTPI